MLELEDLISCMGTVPGSDVEMEVTFEAVLSLFIGILQNGPQFCPPNRFNSSCLIFFLHTNMMKIMRPCKAFIMLAGYQTIAGTRSISIHHAISSKTQLIPITMNSFRYIFNLPLLIFIVAFALRVSQLLSCMYILI